MVEFKLIKQIRANGSFGGPIYTEFTFCSEDYWSEEKLIDKFLHSIYFSHDSQPDWINDSNNKPTKFSKEAFNIKKINTSDFKAYSRENLSDFFVNARKTGGHETESFKDKGKEFNALIDQYMQWTNNQDGLFFAISIDWFSKVKNMINPPHPKLDFLASLCDYYWIIIGIDINKNILSVCRWFYD